MLKLLKYEWKACARTCLPLYGVLILMSLISRILYVIPKNASLDFMLPAIGSMLYMGVMMAAFVVTAVILIQRFYKNLLGSEGYLMFTLPVTVSQDHYRGRDDWFERSVGAHQHLHFCG